MKKRVILVLLVVFLLSGCVEESPFGEESFRLMYGVSPKFDEDVGRFYFFSETQGRRDVDDDVLEIFNAYDGSFETDDSGYIEYPDEANEFLDKLEAKGKLFIYHRSIHKEEDVFYDDPLSYRWLW